MSDKSLIEFEQYANPNLVNLYYSGYERIVFNRTLLVSCIILDLSLLISQILHGVRGTSIVWEFVIVSIVSIVVVSLWKKWLRERSEYEGHLVQLESLVEKLKGQK